MVRMVARFELGSVKTFSYTSPSILPTASSDLFAFTSRLI